MTTAIHFLLAVSAFAGLLCIGGFVGWLVERRQQLSEWRRVYPPTHFQAGRVIRG